MEIYSKIDKTILLHKVVFLNEIETLKNERVDCSQENEFLQLSILNYNSGKIFDAHYHLKRAKYFEFYWAQESWIVIRGSVRAIYFDIDNQFISDVTLSHGDISVSFQGGHAYEIIEDSTIVYELKTGPYEGKVVDKRQIIN